MSTVATSNHVSLIDCSFEDTLGQKLWQYIVQSAKTLQWKFDTEIQGAASDLEVHSKLINLNCLSPLSSWDWSTFNQPLDLRHEFSLHCFFLPEFLTKNVLECVVNQTYLTGCCNCPPFNLVLKVTLWFVLIFNTAHKMICSKYWYCFGWYNFWRRKSGSLEREIHLQQLLFYYYFLFFVFNITLKDFYVAIKHTFLNVYSPFKQTWIAFTWTLYSILMLLYFYTITDFNYHYHYYCYYYYCYYFLLLLLSSLFPHF